MRFLLRGLALLLAASLSSAPRNFKPGDAPDRLMVLWRSGLSRLDLDAEAARLGLGGPKADPQAALHGRAGAQGLRRADLLPLDVVRLAPGSTGADVDRALAVYRASPLVQSAEPDAPLAKAALPNDPAYSAQWGLVRTDWPAVWNAYPAGLSFVARVTVAVLDTGIDAHPDLSGQLLTGASFVDSEPSTDDLNGHGTFCGGLIAALPNNSQGISGAFVDPAFVRLLPVKVLDGCGSGAYSNVALGILYAAQQGAQVLNLSLSGADDSDILREAVRAAQARGCVLVAAAGNNASSVGWPAAYASVISVAALDNSDTPAWYSNSGKVDLSAPGGAGLNTCTCMASAGGCPNEIWSLTAQQPGCSGSNPACGFSNYLEAGGGTSFAAPLVSAAAAMLLAQQPGLSPDQVLQRLVQSAQPSSQGPGFHAQSGWGKLDFYKALTLTRFSGPGAKLRAYPWPNPYWPDRDGQAHFTVFLPQPQALQVRLLDAGGDLVRQWNFSAAETWAGQNLIEWDGLNGVGRKAAVGGYRLVVESGGERVVQRVALLR